MTTMDLQFQVVCEPPVTALSAQNLFHIKILLVAVLV